MKKVKKRLIITSLLITILIISFLLSGCSNVSKYAKSKSEKASGESAVVDYTCVSKPKSEKKIYVILKNYHGDYWKTVIEGIERAAKELMRFILAVTCLVRGHMQAILTKKR